MLFVISLLYFISINNLIVLNCPLVLSVYSVTKLTNFVFMFLTLPQNRGSYTSGHFICNLWNSPLILFINGILSNIVSM